MRLARVATRKGNEMKPGLEPLTERLKTLPIDSRGYPVPWFVAETEPGVYDFRLADPFKFEKAIKDNRCWVCGGKMGSFKTFVIGPMCGVNRVTAEPPCHLDCAQWSARNCPFLANPNMVRNEHNLHPDGRNPGGEMIKRNPGVCLLWTTKTYKVKRVHNGHLIEIGEPIEVFFYAKGKLATREQIDEAVETGCPLLENMAKEEGPKAHEMFTKMKSDFVKIIDRSVLGVSL